MELLTQSKYRGWRGCPRFFYHRHEQRLSPRLEREGRRRGTIFGSAIFAVQQAEENGRLIEIEETGLSHRFAVWQVIDETVESFYSDFHPSSQDEQDELALEAVKVSVMARAYLGRYGIDRRREVVFEMPLLNPVTGRQSRTFRRAGKIDGVVPLGNNHALVIEDKFVGQIQKAMIDRLVLDQQIAEYVDALAQRGWTAEIEYRHTRYPGVNPSSAKEYKTKANVPAESLDDFAIRLAADVTDREEFYFDMQRLVFDASSLVEHREGRWAAAKGIMFARQQLRENLPLGIAFPKHEWKCNQYGSCEFLPLCTNQEGAEALYVVGEDNPELKI
jgi:hypothetical protein